MICEEKQISENIELMKTNTCIINNTKLSLNHSIHDLKEIMNLNNHNQLNNNDFLILEYDNKEAVEFFKKLNNYNGQVKDFDKYNMIIECEFHKTFKLDKNKVLFLREEKKETQKTIKTIRYYYTRRHKREYNNHLEMYMSSYIIEDFYFKIELIDYKDCFNFEYAFNKNKNHNSTFKTATKNNKEILDNINNFKRNALKLA